MGAFVFYDCTQLSLVFVFREVVMSNLEVLDILYQAFQLALKLAMPFLLTSMIVGV